MGTFVIYFFISGAIKKINGDGTYGEFIINKEFFEHAQAIGSGGIVEGQEVKIGAAEWESAFDEFEAIINFLNIAFCEWFVGGSCAGCCKDWCRFRFRRWPCR